MLTFTDAQLRKKLQDGLRVDTQIEFLPFSDVDASVRDDVEAIRSSRLLIGAVGSGRLSVQRAAVVGQMEDFLVAEEDPFRAAELGDRPRVGVDLDELTLAVHRWPAEG
jgi:hypothetical protein